MKLFKMITLLECEEKVHAKSIKTKKSIKTERHKKGVRKLCERADSRSKKNYNFAACGTKTTFTERETK